MINNPNYLLIEIQYQTNNLTYYINSSTTFPEDNNYYGIYHKIKKYITQLLYLKRRRIL